MKLNIKLLNDNAKIPTYGSEFAAGLDLYSSKDYEIPPQTRQLVSTGIAVSWEEDSDDKHYLRIAPRSGLSVKNSIDVGAGVVDYDYRGEVFVCLINNSTTKIFEIKIGDRIAQAILEKIERFDSIIEVSELTETVRGIGGFGSTGK
jgi:dUTP pyrophosphatase